MRYTIENCAIVLLAAGNSSRLGNPKQLLVYKGKNLLQQAIDTALQTALNPVVVVLGSNSEAIKKRLNCEAITIVENEEWQEGMASSLRFGVATMQQLNPAVDGIVFMVCDQPFVTPQLLTNLLRVQQETGLPIIASSYEDNLGTPALFHKSLFNELMELKGDTGARKLIKKHEDLVTTVPFPKGIIDIDNAVDYEHLTNAGI